MAASRAVRAASCGAETRVWRVAAHAASPGCARLLARRSRRRLLSAGNAAPAATHEGITLPGRTVTGAAQSAPSRRSGMMMPWRVPGGIGR